MMYELYGLPGAGKSALVKDNPNLIRLSYKEKWKYGLMFIVRYPLVAVITVLIAITSLRYVFHKIRVCIFDRGGRYMKAKKRRGGIIDEGLYQNILSLFEHQVPHKILKLYVSLLPVPDTLLVIDEPISIIKARDATRLIKPRRALSVEGRGIWWKNMIANYATAMPMLKSKMVTRVIVTTSNEAKILI
jgi:hypothetical protein